MPQSIDAPAKNSSRTLPGPSVDTLRTDQIEGALQRAVSYFDSLGYQPFPFQREAWRHYLEGNSGLVNAPTGSGKTLSLLMPIALQGLIESELQAGARKGPLGMRAIWISPIRALTKEIASSAETTLAGLGLDWEVAIRSGDTSSSERAKQKRRPPQILVTTPESLQLMLSSAGHAELLSKLRCVVVDEWHELMGSKRGVQTELALSRLRALRPQLRVWGISATIGNLQQGLDVLLANTVQPERRVMVRAEVEKYTEIETVMPEEIERFPWAGHLGIAMLQEVLPILLASSSTIIFTNTRSQCEIWYQRLLAADPELAGQIAMHHGSIDRELRDWVEDAIHTEKLKVVVATSSLDLGVDFRPVETIVQIGSPKGVARFMQRAGRSGHRPGATSSIYFVPTHSLELIEASAL